MTTMARMAGVRLCVLAVKPRLAGADEAHDRAGAFVTQDLTGPTDPGAAFVGTGPARVALEHWLRNCLNPPLRSPQPATC